MSAAHNRDDVGVDPFGDLRNVGAGLENAGEDCGNADHIGLYVDDALFDLLKAHANRCGTLGKVIAKRMPPENAT